MIFNFLILREVSFGHFFTCTFHYYPPDRREQGNKRCLCPSVCPYFLRCVQRIIREPKGLACPNLERRFLTLDTTCTPVSRSNGQRSGLQTGGGIPCRPNSSATLLVSVKLRNQCEQLISVLCVITQV